MTFDFFPAEQRSNYLRAQAAPSLTADPGIWGGFARGAGEFTMKGLAEVGRSVDLLGSVGPIISDKLTGGNTTEDYFREHDEVFNRAVDYWTPGPGEVGAAGQVVGSLVSGLATLAVSPALAVGTAQLSSAEDLVRKGVDAGKAQAVGLVNAAGLGLGIYAPILGNTMAQRVILGGAGFNLLQGVATRGINQQILAGTGAAKDYNPWDAQGLVIDGLMGAAFGGLRGAQVSAMTRRWDRLDGEQRQAMFSKLPDADKEILLRRDMAEALTPSQKDAILTVNQQRHIEDTTAPGTPVTPVDLTAHVEAMKSAVRSLLAGDAVDVEGSLRGVEFKNETARAEAQQQIGGEIESAARAAIMEMVPLYHGSPHDFDAFSMDKIGTGEGAQAYGHGLYFAENEGVAKGYREALTSEGAISVNGKIVTKHDDPSLFRAAKLLRDGRKFSGVEKGLERAIFVENVMPRTEDDKQKTIAILHQIKDADIKNANAGALYKVDIPAESVARMLDWDKPLRDQPDSIKAIAKKYKIPEQYNEFNNPNHKLKDKTGADVYQAIASDLGGFDKASDYLASIGIPGIKYLDAGSRSEQDGTRNLVVFDDSLIKITHKNGEPVDTSLDVIPPAPPPPLAREAPIVRFTKMAKEIEDSAPPVEDGYTRLWRGNRNGEVGKNPQFTNSLAGIALPFKEAYGGPLSYVDVPSKDAGGYLNDGGVVAKGAEFILPAGIAAKAKEIVIGGNASASTKPRDPLLEEAAARIAANPDMVMHMGQDAAGKPVTAKMGDLMAKAADDVQQARKDADLFTVAAQCFLGAA